jgi:hypothetical protein
MLNPCQTPLGERYRNNLCAAKRENPADSLYISSEKQLSFAELSIDFAWIGLP